MHLPEVRCSNLADDPYLRETGWEIHAHQKKSNRNVYLYWWEKRMCRYFAFFIWARQTKSPRPTLDREISCAILLYHLLLGVKPEPPIIVVLLCSHSESWSFNWSIRYLGEFSGLLKRFYLSQKRLGKGYCDGVRSVCHGIGRWQKGRW